MKYFRLFQTHALHEQERLALEKLGIYISYCEDNDEVTFFYKKKSKPKYEVGDYLLSSGEVIKNANYTSGMDVIGVCVIPDNFISQEGINSKARFCALAENKGLQYKTSNTEDTGLFIFDKIGCVGENPSGRRWIASNTLTHNGDNGGYMSCMASHFDKTVENPYDPGTYWNYNEYHHIASPYLYVNGEYVFNDGVYNGCVDGAVSMLSDMDGLANTAIINDSDHPAANYCANYSTNGTAAGDWYLPAEGELAFILPRFDTILNAISKAGGTTFYIYDDYWSSTLYSTSIYSDSHACIISIENAHVYGGFKDYANKVRPFLRLD